MQTLIVKPQNKEELQAIESVLKVLKINFIVEENEALPAYVVEGTMESLLEAEAGKLTPFTSVREMLDLEWASKSIIHPRPKSPSNFYMHLLQSDLANGAPINLSDKFIRDANDTILLLTDQPYLFKKSELGG